MFFRLRRPHGEARRAHGELLAAADANMPAPWGGRLGHHEGLNYFKLTSLTLAYIDVM